MDRIDANGKKLCPTGATSNPCDGFSLSKNQDSTLFDNVATEALNIGGAPLNVYKLLGITAINDPQNITGRGIAISSQPIPGFSIERVYTGSGTFRSAARGFHVTQEAFVGYDFGEMPLAGRGNVQRYSDRLISQLTLNQSHCLENTASRIRVESSQDGISWRGVTVINASPGLQKYNFSTPTPARYWRIRPTEFRGGPSDFWEVTSLHFGESGIAELENIEDKVLFENRSREYSLAPVELKGRFDHQDSMMELFAHGMGLTQQTAIEVSFTQCVALLGRPLVIGDIIEMPSELMYDQNLKVVRKFVEVMDVAWSSTSYTPGWVPTLLRVMVSPAIASRETKQIFGATHKNKIDPAGFFETVPAVEGAVVQEYDSIIDAIRSEARAAVPQRGIDQSGTGEPTLQEQQTVANEAGIDAVKPFIKSQKGLYVEDALPPNGEPYTESTELPTSGMKDGDWHRVIYTGSAGDIPARLHRYSAVKGRWIYVESDKRSLYDPLSPMVGPKTLK